MKKYIFLYLTLMCTQLLAQKNVNKRKNVISTPFRYRQKNRKDTRFESRIRRRLSLSKTKRDAIENIALNTT